MTIDGAATDVGYLHDLFVYDSDEELLGFLVVYLHDGIEAHQPVVVQLPPRETALVEAAAGTGDGVTFLTGVPDRGPTAQISTLRALLADLAAGTSAQIRVATVVPHPGLGAPWHPWSRYEAAINDVFADLPMWCVCLYDRRVTPDHVLADLERTHPHIRTGDGTQLPNAHYQDSRAFLQSMPPAPPDPLEATPPAAELVDPSPAQARRSAEQAAHDAGLTGAEIDDTKIAVSEAVTNAINYGTPPTTMKLWTDPGRLLVTVTDHGQGPPDPYAGLIQTAHPDGAPGGYGLWITHQLATATHSRTETTFTIRLVTGKPLP
jgi:anti-sigma regulatory factor (Ser/Thr protein kinase)